MAIPVSPTNVRTTSVISDMITFAWDAVTGASSYQPRIATFYSRNALVFSNATTNEDRVVVNAQASLVSSTYTVEAKVKLSSNNNGSHQTILSINSNSPTGNRINFVARRGATGNRLSYWDNNNTWKETGFTLQYDVEYHITFVVVSASKLVVYVDGELVLNTTLASAFPTVTGYVWIGASGNTFTTQEWFSGTIRDVRIWNVERNATQIIDNIDKELVGDETGLKAYFPLDEGTGMVANNKVSDGLTGSIQGTTSWTNISSRNVIEVGINTTNLTYTFEGLSPNTYSVGVSAVNNEGQSKISWADNIVIEESVNPRITAELFVGKEQISSQASFLPFVEIYHDQRIQYVVLESELLDAGISRGNTLYSIGLKVGSSLPTIDLNKFTVRMKHISRDYVADNSNLYFDEVGLITVRSPITIAGSSFTPTQPWVDIEFDKPFIYQGDNLLIDIMRDNTTWTQAGSNMIAIVDSPSLGDRAIGAYADSSKVYPYSNIQWQTGTADQVPVTRFTLEDTDILPSPIVNIISVSRDKVSDEDGADKVYITFNFDVDTLEFTVNVNGISYDTGIVAHRGGAKSIADLASMTVGELAQNTVQSIAIVVAGYNIVAEIDWTELYQEGQNRINIYGKSADGIWTEYNQS